MCSPLADTFIGEETPAEEKEEEKEEEVSFGGLCQNLLSIQLIQAPASLGNLLQTSNTFPRPISRASPSDAAARDTKADPRRPLARLNNKLTRLSYRCSCPISF